MSVNVRSRSIDVGGIRTHYLEAGDGPPLLLLHSGEFGASAELTWEYNVEPLAERYRVIAPDWLGFGRTDKLRDFVSGTDRMLRHLAAFVNVLALDGPVDTVGCSMGGTLLVREAARSHPRLHIDRMVLCSAGGFVPDHQYRRWLLDYDGSFEGMRRILQATIADPRWADDEAYVQRRVDASLAPGAWEAIAAARFKAPNIPTRQHFGQQDTTPYEKIPSPTLVVAGAEDRLREPHYYDVMRDRIPQCEVVVVPDAGHLLNIEQPEAFNAAVTDFLDRAPSRRNSKEWEVGA